eukprot:m.166320 g.166320  ORF g.166320 m.166320 type:complete len:624 (+) comp13445_c4_seq3:159-2030(+)
MIVQNMGAYQTRPSLEKEVEEGADQYQRAYACGSMQGWRKSQEDAYVAIPKEDEYSIFGVFDGHGGSEVSALVANNFVQMLHKHCGSEWHKDIPASVTRTFKMMDLYAKSKEGQDEMKRILQLGEVQHYLLHSNLLLSTLTCCSFNCSIVSFSLSSFVLIMHLDVVGPLHSFYKKKKDTDTVPEVDDDEVSKLQEEAVMPLEILVGSRLRGVDGENEDTDKGNDTLEVPVEKLSEENPKKKPKSTTKSVEETSSSSSSSVSVTEATSSTATTSSITKTSTRKVRTLRRELTTTSLQKEKEDKDAKEVVKPLITVEEIAQANDESDESTQDSTQSTENDDSNGDCGEEEDASYDAKNHANSNGKDDDDDDDDGDFIQFKDESSRLFATMECGFLSGTTANVLFLSDTKAVVANTGDCRTVLCRKGKAIELSKDHKPTDEEELNRIIKAGSFVSETGRIENGLNLSRALGDWRYKNSGLVTHEDQAVSYVPDFAQEDLCDDDEFLIVACDGIWNTMTSQDAVDFIRVHLSQGVPLQSTMEKLLDACLSPSIAVSNGDGLDNETAIIVVLKDINGMTVSPEKPLRNFFDRTSNDSSEDEQEEEIDESVFAEIVSTSDTTYKETTAL